MADVTFDLVSDYQAKISNIQKARKEIWTKPDKEKLLDYI